MNKTNDVEKVRGERDRIEEGELKAEMGQYVFLLYFHLEASLRSLFPEHGGICMCACVCAHLHVCTGVCVYVHRLMCKIVSMHILIYAYTVCVKLFVCSVRESF